MALQTSDLGNRASGTFRSVCISKATLPCSVWLPGLGMVGINIWVNRQLARIQAPNSTACGPR